MKPIGKFILVRHDQAEKSKIIIPDARVPRPNTGAIVSVGGDVDFSELMEGERIMFRDLYTAQAVPGASDLLVMSQDNVMLIM